MFYTYVDRVGSSILHRYVDDNGKRCDEFNEFSPTLYLPTNSEDSTHTGIRGETLVPRQYETMRSAQEFIKSHKNISNFKIFGNTNYWAQFIQEQYTGEIEWDMDQLVIANLDIECLMDDPDNPGLNPIENPIDGVNRITAITVEVNNEYVVFGSKAYTGKKLPLGAVHTHYETEEELLTGFLQHWRQLAPDIITGWNINYFDIPYLVGRIRDILGGSMVNYLGSVAAKYTKRVIDIREQKNGDTKVAIKGVSIIDYLEIYKKFTYKTRERYSLDFIASVELGHKKLDYSEYGNLDGLYAQNYNKYIDYNIRDVELVRRLDDKLNLMLLVLSLTYMCHIRHEDVFGQVMMWDTLIYNKLLEDNVVVPPKVEYRKDEKYEGAYVREPKVGMHEWVVSFDLNSLYPHLIMQYNISPEMLVENTFDETFDFGMNELVDKTANLDFVKEENLSMAGNKVFFNRDKQGFLGAMMESLYNKRKAIKKEMLVAESDVERIRGVLRARDVTV